MKENVKLEYVTPELKLISFTSEVLTDLSAFNVVSNNSDWLNQ